MKKFFVLTFVFLACVAGALSACSPTHSASGTSEIPACSEKQMYAFGETRLAVVHENDSKVTREYAERQCRLNDKLLSNDCKLDCTKAGEATQAFCDSGAQTDDVIHLNDVRHKDCEDFAPQSSS